MYTCKNKWALESTENFERGVGIMSWWQGNSDMEEDYKKKYADCAFFPLLRGLESSKPSQVGLGD